MSLFFRAQYFNNTSRRRQSGRRCKNTITLSNWSKSVVQIKKVFITPVSMLIFSPSRLLQNKIQLHFILHDFLGLLPCPVLLHQGICEKSIFTISNWYLQREKKFMRIFSTFGQFNFWWIQNMQYLLFEICFYSFGLRLTRFWFFIC